MRYEINFIDAQETVVLEYLDWLHLLNLAALYGWGAGEDREALIHHYLHEAHSMPTDEAREFVVALKVANDALETEGGSEAAPQPTGQTVLINPGLLKGPSEGALAYFSGEKGRLVSMFIGLLPTGRLEITQLEP